MDVFGGCTFIWICQETYGSCSKRSTDLRMYLAHSSTFTFIAIHCFLNLSSDVQRFHLNSAKKILPEDKKSFSFGVEKISKNPNFCATSALFFCFLIQIIFALFCLFLFVSYLLCCFCCHPCLSVFFTVSIFYVYARFLPFFSFILKIFSWLPLQKYCLATTMISKRKTREI